MVARDATAQLVGYAGVMFVVDDAHVTNIAVRAATAAHWRRHAVCSPSWRGRRSIASARR